MNNSIHPSGTTTLWGTLNDQVHAINDNQTELLRRQEVLNELIKQDTKQLTDHTQAFTNWKNDSSGYGLATNEELATGDGIVGSITKAISPYSGDIKASEMDAQQQNIQVIQERLDGYKKELKALSQTLNGSYGTENAVHIGAGDVIKHYGGYMHSPIQYGENNMPATNPTGNSPMSNNTHRFSAPNDNATHNREEAQSNALKTNPTQHHIDQKLQEFTDRKMHYMLMQAEREDADLHMKTLQDMRKHTTDTYGAMLNGMQDTGNKINNAGTQVAKGVNF